jgi:hypothetical protein
MFSVKHFRSTYQFDESRLDHTFSDLREDTFYHSTFKIVPQECQAMQGTKVGRSLCCLQWLRDALSQHNEKLATKAEKVLFCIIVLFF